MQRSFTFVCLLVVLLSLLAAPVQAQDASTPEPVGLRPDAPPYALHGPYWVGTVAQVSETEMHHTRVQIWYPALNPRGSAGSFNYIAFGMVVRGNALRNADPDLSGAPYPLVLVAHGLGGANTVYTYLCEHLASYGFVVMAIDYADSGQAAFPVDPALSMYTRPTDITWQINRAEALHADESSPLFGMVDMDLIAVVGHSYGGYTALTAGGALLDLAGPTSWCVVRPNLRLVDEIGGGTLQERFCDPAPDIAELAGLETVPEATWPSWADARVDAIVPMAPAAFVFGAESAASVTVPTMLMVGSADRFVYFADEIYKPYLYDSLGSTTKAMVTFEGGGHSLFNISCPVAPWFIDWGLFWACSDSVWDMERAHDLINHFTTAFLLSTLKGDAEATAALAPEAVAFPGIEYQAEGF